MNMDNNKSNPNVIDLRVVFKNIKNNKKLFYKVLPVVFVVSCIYIFSIPRYYSSEVKLAPEMESGDAGGVLGSIASSFGFNFSEMQTSDAITPLLYPDLMEDNGFVSNLMNIKVREQEEEHIVSYHDYLEKYQKKAWWGYPIDGLKSLLIKKKDEGGSKNGYDPYNISRNENSIFEKARENINIKIDKKTGVITINTTAQDPLVCKTMADSIKDRLQAFITDYRTNKARIDYNYYKQLAIEAKQEYEKARQRYGAYIDGNVNIAMQSVRLKAEEMESEMELKLNNYNTMNTQMQAAKAKIQERTPAFTVIKGATVPVKPSGPKRMIFVAGMLFLACFATIIYLARKDFHFNF